MVDQAQDLGSGSLEDGQNGTPVRGTSPRLRGNGEGDALVPRGCSPELGRWHDHGRASTRNGSSASATAGRRRRTKNAGCSTGGLGALL
jgi:hypothetical protein